MGSSAFDRRTPLRIGLAISFAIVLLAPGASALASIPSGNVLALDGSDDYATVADNSTLDLGDTAGEDFTVETFFKVVNAADLSLPDVGVYSLVAPIGGPLVEEPPPDGGADAGDAGKASDAGGGG